MIRPLWQDVLLPPGNQDLTWELFHENSKFAKFQKSRSEEEILTWMDELHESLAYDGYPKVDLPTSLQPLRTGLSESMATRTSVRNLLPKTLSLETLGTLLYSAYGVTRRNEGTAFSRQFRTAPSAGALYPLELYVYSTHIEGLSHGLHHYNPLKNQLRLLKEGEDTDQIAQALVQPEVALHASLLVFITAVFERSVFKYGDRGYRFTFLEAGHVGQNLNLATNALGLGCLNIGGYHDRVIDNFLGLDGLTHSTIYMVAIGGKGEEKSPP